MKPGAHEGKIEGLAAAWVARRDAGLSASETAELKAWLAADARHQQAFAHYGAGWAMLDRPVRSGDADEVLQQLERLDRQRSRKRIVAGAVAALALIAGASLWTIARRPAAQPPGAMAATARVLVPEKQTLADGSVVELKDGAQIEVHFEPGRRGILLRRGEAHFQVAKDATRPFVVAANGVEFRAVGTAFTVQMGAAAVDVVVTEGHVAVDPSPAAESRERPAQAILSPGQQGVVEPGAKVAQVRSLAAAELADRLAWRSPRLEFSGTPLREVVQLLNEQASVRGETHFAIGDEAIAQVRVSGLFRADNTAALLELLDSGFGIAAEHTAAGTIVLRRAAGK